MGPPCVVEAQITADRSPCLADRAVGVQIDFLVFDGTPKPLDHDVVAPSTSANLMPLGRTFDGFVEHTKRVSPTCLIHFERNRYSVPASFANRPVSLRVYPDRLIVAAEGRILCEHVRVIERSHHLPGRTIYDWRHYLAVIQRKPGAPRNGAPFLEMPEAFRQLQGHLLKRPGGDREMVEILALVLQHDEQAVLCAVELALEAGVPTKTHVLNILHRLTDGKAGPRHGSMHRKR